MCLPDHLEAVPDIVNTFSCRAGRFRGLWVQHQHVFASPEDFIDGILGKTRRIPRSERCGGVLKVTGRRAGETRWGSVNGVPSL